MSDGDKPVANPDIVLREEFDDWAILFDPDTGDCYGLNPTGVFIWKLLDGRHSIEEIVQKLRGEAEGVPETASEQVAGFTRALEKKGFVGFEFAPPAA